MDKNKHDVNEARALPQKGQDSGSLTCDPEKYRKYLENFDLSEEEQVELLRTLWTIMAGFVDLGFGVDSIQFLPKDNKQLPPIERNRQNQCFTDPKEAKKLGSSSNKGD